MAIGKISEFNLQEDNWRLYVERLEQYFTANAIDDKLHVSTLITVIGSECYELLVNLCTPNKPCTKTFSELTAILEAHLQPKPSILAERYKFRNRKQQSGESIAEYVAALKKMSTTCEFKANLMENLRDQFACNIHSENIRQRLFTEENLDFSKAYRLAVSLEAAEKDAAAVIQGGCDAIGTSRVQCQSIASGGSIGRSPVGGPWSTRSRGGGSALRDKRAGAGRCAGRPAAAGASGPGEQARRQQQAACRACGAAHDTGTCRFAKYVCRVCNKQGHLRRVCPYLTEHYSVEMSTSTTGIQEEDDLSDEVIIDINRLSLNKCPPIIITVKVHGQDINMECDTGSAVSCINYEVYKEKFSDLVIKPSRLTLRYYTGELVHPVGVVRPEVEYNGKRKILELYIIKDGKTILLGRQWLAELGIRLTAQTCENVFKIDKQIFNLSNFSSRYCEVFADGLGRFTGGAVSIHVREGARPVFLRARPLAYALREPVERALEQLVRDDILEPVECSDWATPIVPVVKKDGTIRICADYKLTLNKVLVVDRYPLPKVEDLLARLHGGKRFSKIDLSQAYAQFELDESRKYTVINTHKGMFMYKRLVYGLSSSPGIFQRRLEQLFCDLPYVGVFLDDVIITGRDDRQHLENLHKVFERLQSHGLRVKKEKCTFFAESIEYLGHVITKDGVHTCQEKVKAVVNTPVPTNVSELRAFIGLVMYYGKFINNVSMILAPMYNLLRAGVKYEWSQQCQAAFDRVKRALSSSQVLVHYTPELPLVLTTDASGTGIGAVISHLTSEGERPIAYASRTLTATERGYAQFDREALSIIYGIRKFHQYLYGRKFTLRTDHKPLTYIFGNKVGIPVMAASRIQRWAILLSGYTYDIEYVTSAKNCADALSRLPQATHERMITDEVTYLNFVEKFLPVTNSDVKTATSKDPVMTRVMAYLQSGWPSQVVDEKLKPYFLRRNELYIERGCIMWGYRIIIPTSLRSKVLGQLHASHMGIVKTKSSARSYVWWPDIDSDVETICRQCETCAAEAQAPPRAPPQPWPYTSQPWSRLHVDFLGPFQGKTYFVLVDSSTKWIEIFEMPRTNAAGVIKVMRTTFARFGLPTEVVSDQGPPFTSTEYSNFLLSNGIRQSFSPVYHPSSNGAAENAVKLCKRAIKKACRDSVDIDTALQTFLLAYRNSIHSTTGESPAMLLQRRQLRSRLDLLRSSRALEDRVQDAQQKQVEAAGGVSRDVMPGDTVWARNYGTQDKWVKGRVLDSEGSRRYTLGVNGRQLTRHVDQIRRRSSVIYPSTTTPVGDDRCSVEGDVGAPLVVPEVDLRQSLQGEEVLDERKCTDKESELQFPHKELLSPSLVQLPSPPPVLQPSVSRTERIRKPPVRFGFEID